MVSYYTYSRKYLISLAPPTSMSSKDIKYPNTDDNSSGSITQGVFWSFLSVIKNFFKKTEKTTVIKPEFRQGNSQGAFQSMTTDEKSTIAKTFQNGWYSRKFKRILNALMDPENPDIKELDGG